MENKIDAIMDSFDFTSVAKCMKLLEWGWNIGDGNFTTAVPEEYEIRQKARKLMKECCYTGMQLGRDKEKFTYKFCTAGFEVALYKNTEQGEPVYDVTLKFILEQQDSYSLLGE